MVTFNYILLHFYVTNISLDHVGINRVTLFSDSKILHAPLVGTEIVSFGA